MTRSRKQASLVVRAVLVAPLLAACLGAGNQSANFAVEAADPAIAAQVAKAAEQLRHDLAVEWLGSTLPDWPKRCTITVVVGSRLAPGGATTTVYDRGEVFVWRMSVQGAPERIFDCVLPHEMTHAIFASYFRRQLPRWADEGGATNVEAECQKAKYRAMLIKCLNAGRGIDVGPMLATTEYPADVWPMYSESYALAEFLIQRGGRRKYIAFLTDGLKDGQWSNRIREYYAYADVDQLQTAWSDWITQRFPAPQPPSVGASVASSSLPSRAGYLSK
jgi:hypothetical protein